MKDGRIAAVGRLGSVQSATVIDATGKYQFTPGFIDIHSHADDGASKPRGGFRDPDARRRAAPNLVMQGITTIIINHDGRSPWPIGDSTRWSSGHGVGPNAILIAGHGTVRRLVMGADNGGRRRRRKSGRCGRFVGSRWMKARWGCGPALEYMPGRWSTTDELVRWRGKGRRSAASTSRTSGARATRCGMAEPGRPDVPTLLDACARRSRSASAPAGGSSSRTSR